MSFYYVTPEPRAADESETLAHNTEHVEQAIAHLIPFFRQPRTQAWLGVVGGKIQELEDALWALYSEGFLATAIGTQLDQIGEIVNEARQDRDDEDYRAAVRVRVLVNKSSGRVEELLAIAVRYLATLQVATPVVSVREYPPAALRIDIGAQLYNFQVPAGFYLLGLLRQAKAAGVALTATMYDQDAGFVCAARTPALSAAGCGDRTGATGGLIAIGR